VLVNERVLQLRYCWDAWRTTRAGPAAVASRQRARFGDLVQFARQRSPFYRQLYQHLPAEVNDPRQLPPVTKARLMASLEACVTDPAVTRAGVATFLADRTVVGQRYRGRYAVWSTSGVTGVRGFFLHDPQAVALYRSLTFLRGWIGRMTPNRLWSTLRHGNRVATVVTTGGHYGGSSIMEAARRDHPWPFNRVRVFSALAPLPELVAELNQFQPTQLIAYPSALTLLAREQIAGRLQIGPVLVASGGEKLLSWHRDLIGRAFDCPLRENYGVSEFPALAWDCREQRLHLSSDWAILEPVDAEYQPVPVGQWSHSALLTNLANRVQPLIRYDVGDRIRLVEERCRCGNPLPVVEVEGRSADVVSLRAPSGEIVSLLPGAVRRVAWSAPGLERVQVVQTGPAALRVRLENAPDADAQQVWEATAQNLRRLLAAHGLPNVTVERAAEPPQLEPFSGKFRDVWPASAPPSA
jgi:phenylacetate-coenzyme A ligase PaaK-like adenylate-forming protein